MRDYEPDVSQILALYQQLEDDMIASMTKRMLKMGKVSESTKYEAEILQAAGIVYQDVLELIAQRTDATKQHVKALFEDAGVQTLSIDNQIHKQNGILPVDIRQDASLLQILEAGYKKTLGTMKNLVNTTANLAQTAFISACDRAYMQVSSGAFSYQQAIRQAVKSFGDTGAMVQYPSGHRERMDVAVRRAVLTGVGQTSASVALQHAKDSDCKFMELTAHSGARPDHAAWQGQLVSLDGKNVGKIIDGLRVFSLDQIGYGTGAGFKGWNCRHNWHPYYVGLSTPNYTPEQLKALDAKNIEYNGKFYTEYEISQMQRAAERKVRVLKRQVIASQTALENAPDDLTRAELQADYTQNAVKLKKARKALQEFCKQTGRRNDTFRTQVEGFSRSQAQKAVWADKKSQKDLTFTPLNIQEIFQKFLNNSDKKGSESIDKSNKNGIIKDRKLIVNGKEILVTISERTHKFPDGRGRSKFKRDAIIFHIEDDMSFIFPKDLDSNNQTMTPEIAISAWQSVPKALREKAPRVIEFVDYENPIDAIWRKRYLNFNASYACSGNDRIVFWKRQSPHILERVIETYCHEIGHTIDANLLPRGKKFSETSEWISAIEKDKIISGFQSPTVYGRNSIYEDFAESVKEYVKNPILFSLNFPNRYSLLKKIIGKL
ncbi:MAG: hypothetical protein K2H29_12200 [Oscillospiraceae bacterium]|nr:hypothetical protein [Oscillospiraceae bacterium]